MIQERDFTKALKGLTHIYGASSTFLSSEQARAITASVQAQQDLICVLPTNGGKSACFFVSAALKDGVTILIVPVKVLVNEMFRGRTRNRSGYFLSKPTGC
ncbi:MAG TPA: DEAD/DEAH box helicase [Sphingobacteriaceae bacterium]